VTDAGKEYHSLGNVQLNEILGAETFPVSTAEDTVLQQLRSKGKKPYAIPSGASSHPLGGLGYARWAFEVLEQEAQLSVTFDTIVVTIGSGSTVAGMIAGFKLAQKQGLIAKPRRLVGFSIMGKSNEVVREMVLDIARTTAEKIGLKREDITGGELEIDDSFLGEAYGVLDERTVEGVKTMARAEGILTDPVYTGKAITGLIHTAKAGAYSGSNVLFCHTGGQVALSAYPALR
jgi:1-aminocyclopropane-1-carboxylate deaminase